MGDSEFVTCRVSQACTITACSYSELVRQIPERMNINWAIRELYSMDGQRLNPKRHLENGMEIVASTGEPFMPRASFLQKIKAPRARRQGQSGSLDGSGASTRFGSQRLAVNDLTSPQFQKIDPTIARILKTYY